MLSQHLIALTNTVDSLDLEKNNIIYGRSVDLKDSMENKVERLEIQIKKWERRVSRFVQKGAANSLSPLKEKIKKIGKKTKLKVGKIKGGCKITNTNITTKRIQQMEEAGHPPIKIRFKRLTNLTAGSQTKSSQRPMTVNHAVQPCHRQSHIKPTS